MSRPIVILVTVKGGDFHTFGFVIIGMVVIISKLPKLVQDSTRYTRVTVLRVLDTELHFPVTGLALILQPFNAWLEVFFLFKIPA